MSAWRWCALAGLATLAVSIAIGRTPGLVPCGPSGGAGAIIALEMARSVADVTALFGGGPCAGRLLAAQRTALWWDMLAFIPAYAVFLMAAVMALRPVNFGLALLGFNLFLIVPVLDWLEGAILFRILGEMPGTEKLFTGLFWMVRPKFAMLALGEIVLAAMLWQLGTRLAKIAAGAIAAGGAVSLLFLVTAPRDPVMMRGYLVAWVALLVVAGVGAVRPGVLGSQARGDG
jgi:hypothetical protein